MGPNEENEQEQNTTPAAGAADPNAATKTTKEKTPAQLLKEERVKEVKAALKSFPKLTAGYVTPRGVYFDEESALKSVDGEEELITKVLPAKK